MTSFLPRLEVELRGRIGVDRSLSSSLDDFSISVDADEWEFRGTTVIGGPRNIGTVEGGVLIVFEGSNDELCSAGSLTAADDTGPMGFISVIDFEEELVDGIMIRLWRI